MSLSQELIAGSRLGRYKIISKLGAGGMGSVYLAEDSRLARQVALKVPRLEVGNTAVLERFLREARLAAGIPHHPNLCPVYDADQVNGTPYFTMPHLAGRPLSDLIQTGKAWAVPRVIEIVRKVALAVGHLHQHRVIHRDLKPANVMILTSGEVMLMDFGLARSFSASSPGLTQSGMALGTPAYMAPEQLSDARQAKEPADVYSLGVMLFELLTSRRPFEGSVAVLYHQILNVIPKPPSHTRPGLDPRLDALCQKAMEKNPAHRQQSVADFLRDLTPFVAEASSSPMSDLAVREFSAPTLPPSSASSVATAAEHKGIRIPGSAIWKSIDWKRRLSRIPVWGYAAFGLTLLSLLLIASLRGGKDQPRSSPTVQGPKRGVAPFDEKEARSLQTEWANYLGKKVEEEIDLSEGTKLTVVLIPPGKYRMGSLGGNNGESHREANEEPHEVEITKPFYLGKFEVTQQQYLTLTRDNPSEFKGPDSLQCPVENVTSEMAKGFCKLLSERLSGSWKRWNCNLPSEAQWEFACRAGSNTPFHFGHTCNGTEANCNGTKPYGTGKPGPNLQRTRIVGAYRGFDNAFGLFDMHGNVFECCADYYGSYQGLPSRDPLRSEKAELIVFRGGSWSSFCWDVRAAARSANLIHFRANDVGFRIALQVDD